MAKAMTAAEVERNRKRSLAALNERHLDCRRIDHSNRTVARFFEYFNGKKRRGRVITEVIRCERCGRERIDRLHPTTFELVSRSTWYPEGYLMPQTGFTRRADVRRELNRREPPNQSRPEGVLTLGTLREYKR